MIGAGLALLATNAIAHRGSGSPGAPGTGSRTSTEETAEPVPMRLRVLQQGFTQLPSRLTGESDLTYAAVIQNPNRDQIASKATVTVTFTDRSGKPVWSHDWPTALLGGQTGAVADHVLAGPVAHMRVQVEVQRWQPASIGPVQGRQAPWRVANVTTVTDQFGATTNATLEAALATDVRNAKAVAVYYDPAGQIVGGASQVVDRLPPGGSARVEIYGYPVLANVAVTVVYAALPSG
jgi:hypothetical protein